MEFQQFKKIPRLSREIILTEKINGCFDYKSRILTDKGYVQIGQIVNNKLKYKVLSYNFDKKQFEMVNILNWFKKEASYKDFLNIKIKGYTRGNAYFSFRCTPNHLILTKQGYKRADELNLSDKLLSPNNPLTFIQKQMILGTLLGDATITIPNKVSLGYSHSQSVKHKIYSQLIKKILDRFFISERITKGGYSNTDIIHVQSNFDIFLQKYLNNFYINHKKYFSYKNLKELSSISLAFWYMDDGACDFNDRQKPRITLATHGFSEKQINILVRTLNNKFNFFPNKKNYGKGFQLNFNSEDTEKFLDLVSPYIVNDLQYKLPKKYRTNASYWDNYQTDKSIFYEQEILEIKPNTLTGNEYNYKYDIETENHNYVISGVVVHNSNMQIYIVKEENLSSIDDYFFIEDFLIDKQDNLLMFVGSRNRWLQVGKNSDNMGCASWCKERSEELFKLGEGRNYAEFYGKGIQCGYGLDHKRMALFNVSRWHDSKTEKRLISVNKETNEEKYTEQCPLCCEVVPILYQGNFDTNVINYYIDKLAREGSVAVPGYNLPEGLVVFHTSAGQYFKKTVLNDEKPKGLKE